MSDSKDKPRAFWFHYNKPESRKRGCNVLTVHYAGQCHLVTDLVCDVPIKVRHRKSQPRCVMAGVGVVVISEGVAKIAADVKRHKSLAAKYDKLQAATIAKMHAAGLCGEEGLNSREADQFPDIDYLWHLGNGDWC